MSDQYEFMHYDWSNSNHVKELWHNEGWRNFDIILGNGTLSGILGLPNEAYKKMICGIWAIPNLSNHFQEIINPNTDITWCSAGIDVQDYLKERYGLDSHLIAGGVSKDDFFPTRKISKITNIGINGVPFVNPGWDEIKRPQMLIDIAKGINGNSVFIHGKSLKESNTMYNDIDMYICTSTNDRGPYGIAEAAFCKIPVISTKTGFALNFKSIKTFETVDEAISIIKELNSSPEKLKRYVNTVYEEITENLNWENIINKYWLPAIKYHLDKNSNN